MENDKPFLSPPEITGDWLEDMILWYLITDPFEDEEE